MRKRRNDDADRQCCTSSGCGDAGAWSGFGEGGFGGCRGDERDGEHGGVLSPLDEALAAVYTTSVAGHDYLGVVQQTAGQYVVSAADPPAAPMTGIGGSIQAAENNLTVVIDERA